MKKGIDVKMFDIDKWSFYHKHREEKDFYKGHAAQMMSRQPFLYILGGHFGPEKIFRPPPQIRRRPPPGPLVSPPPCGFLRPPNAGISRRRGESAKISGFLRKSAFWALSVTLVPSP